MVKVGQPPYLECSLKGDKRFSAFYAHVNINGTISSIESFYQSYKETGVEGSIVAGWRANKGQLAKYGATRAQCRTYYSKLWNMYLEAHPELVAEAQAFNGFTDVFGKRGNCCQAEEIFHFVMRKRGFESE